MTFRPKILSRKYRSSIIPIATGWKIASSASRPNGPAHPRRKPRTSHNVTNVEIIEQRGDEVDVRYNFHTLNHRYKVTDQFFGTIFVTIRKDADGLLIVRKKIVLKNDYIRQVIDIYHI